MVESRCGLLCSQCGYRESTGCKGCVRIEKPFWGEKCPVKSCCEERRLDHCGLCGDFPCGQLLERERAAVLDRERLLWKRRQK